MAGERQNKGLTDRIWDLFSSVKLAVVVFALISLTSMVGTIIEQQADPERNIKLLNKLFGGSGNVVFKALDAAGFTDMYHSWWFISLLFIFAANIIICSIDRLPRIWKVAREPIKPLLEERFDAMPIKKEAAIKAKAEKAREAVMSAMKKAGFNAEIYQEGGNLQFYAEKGRYSRLGVYVTHLSIIVILLGAIAGIFFGFNGALNLLEGRTSSVAYSFGSGKEIPLGFDIRCDDFDVIFYENSDTPKSFTSQLVIIENGKEVLKKQIEVNTPLRYKGVTFYQSSYMFDLNEDAVFKLAVTPNDGKKEDVEFKINGSFQIPGTNISGKVVDFTPALGIDEAGKLFTYSRQMNNPAIFVEFTEKGKVKHQQWLLKRFPQTWKTPDAVIELKDVWGAQATGLQVRKDPGVGVVYLGCLIMIIGLYAAFFMSHRRIWVKIIEDKNITKIKVAGSANKNKIAFEHRIDKLLEVIHG